MSETKRSKLAVASLVVSILGVVLIPLALVGLALGIVALVRIAKSKPYLTGTGFAVAALALFPLAGLTGVGLVMALRRNADAEMRASARTQLLSLSDALYAAHRAGTPVEPLPPTPAQVPCVTKPAPWPADAASGWKGLHFPDETAVRFSYEVAVPPEGGSVARVRADFGCDGKVTTYELTTPKGPGDREMVRVSRSP